MNKGVQNHSSVLKPVLIKNAYDFNENCNGGKGLSAYSSPAVGLKE